MEAINLGILGPFIFALLEAVKRAGFPTKYLPVTSLVLSFGVAGIIAINGQINVAALLTDAAAIYLAVEGAFKNSKRPILSEMIKAEDAQN